MAITTDDLIDKFGIQDEVTSNEANLTDGSFSSGLAWTNDDDAPMASVVLAAHFNTAPGANTPVELHLRCLNVAETTGDEPVPSANWQAGHVGTFRVDALTTDQWPSIDVPLKNTKTSQEFEWYIRNRAGQTLGDSAGSDHWRLFVTPKTQGPHG